MISVAFSRLAPARTLPLLVLMSWLLLTVALFAAGPYGYPVSHPVRLYVFLAAVHTALVAGYFRGSRSYGRDYCGAWSPGTMVHGALAFSAVVTAADLLYTGGGDVARLALALRDPAAAYLESSVRGNPSVFNYIGILTAPVNAIAISAGTFCWSRLRGFERLTLLILVVLAVLGGVGAAVRSALVFTAVFVSVPVSAAFYAGLIRLDRRGRAVAAMFLLLLFVGFGWYFRFLASNRAGVTVDLLVNPLTDEPPRGGALFRVLPDDWQLTAAVAAFYVSHGYYRLDEAMDLPYEGLGFGVANSMFLLRNAVRLTGWSSLENRSYPVRLDREMPNGLLGNYWATGYAWIASDVTFPGCVIVLFFLGYALALAWRDSVSRRNLLAVPALCSLCYLVYSLPMLNPLQDGPGITTFAGLPLLWILTRARTRGRPVARSLSRRS